MKDAPRKPAGAPMVQKRERSPELQASGNDQHEQHNENQTQSAARVVTPTAAVWPRRQRANQKQNQEYQQDCAYRHF
jgi:hypothetical protein